MHLEGVAEEERMNAGPSTAQVAKCATCFAQDDSRFLALRMKTSTHEGCELRLAPFVILHSLTREL